MLIVGTSESRSRGRFWLFSFWLSIYYYFSVINVQGKENKSLAQSSTSLKSSLPLPPLRHQRPSLTLCIPSTLSWYGLPWWLSEEFAYGGGDLGSIYGSGRSLGEGNGYHSSILAWRQRSLAGYSPWGHKESDTTEQLTHHDMEEGPSSPLQELYQGWAPLWILTHANQFSTCNNWSWWVPLSPILQGKKLKPQDHNNLSIVTPIICDQVGSTPIQYGSWTHTLLPRHSALS